MRMLYVTHGQEFSRRVEMGKSRSRKWFDTEEQTEQFERRRLEREKRRQEKEAELIKLPKFVEEE